MSATRRLTRAERRADTKAALLRSAERVFAARGYFAASVDEIAEGAGFSMGAVYSNFATKSDLFLALFEEHIGRQLTDYLALVEATGGVEHQARAGADRWIRYLREHPEYFPLFLEFAATAARDAGLRRALADRLDSFHQAFAGMVTRAAADLGIQVPAEASHRLGVVITALANGLALAKLVDDASVPDDTFGTILALLFGALTGTAHAAQRQDAASTDTRSEE